MLAELFSCFFLFLNTFFALKLGRQSTSYSQSEINAMRPGGKNFKLWDSTDTTSGDSENSQGPRNDQEGPRPNIVQRGSTSQFKCGGGS